jgi:hypothetical protein
MNKKIAIVVALSVLVVGGAFVTKCFVKGSGMCSLSPGATQNSGSVDVKK